MREGRLVVIGVVQEQHPDRTRLYRQWRQLDWPIAVDALNTLNLTAVPVAIGIDEQGIVRALGMRPSDLVDQLIEPTWTAPQGTVLRTEPCHLMDGDRAFHEGKADEAVKAYRAGVDRDSADGRAAFRLGVALQRRWEMPKLRQPGDARAAVEAWARALACNPNQYIWRRRLQQYGPRLTKPYNFYFWVAEARTDILARGQAPVQLTAEPLAAEILPPTRRSGHAVQVVDHDPKDLIVRDTQYVRHEAVAVPPVVRPGGRAQVRVEFFLPPGVPALWNNEAEPLRIVLRPPTGVEVFEGALEWPSPKQAESSEPRIIHVEVATLAALPAANLKIPGYALFNICEKPGGKCLYRRVDFTVHLGVDPAVVQIGR